MSINKISLFLMVFIIFSAGCSKRVDGSSISAFRQSTLEMEKGMSDAEKEEFEKDISNATKLTARKLRDENGADKVLNAVFSDPSGVLAYVYKKLDNSNKSDIRKMSKEWQEIEAAEEKAKFEHDKVAVENTGKIMLNELYATMLLQLRSMAAHDSTAIENINLNPVDGKQGTLQVSFDVKNSSKYAIKFIQVEKIGKISMNPGQYVYFDTGLLPNAVAHKNITIDLPLNQISEIFSEGIGGVFLEIKTVGLNDSEIPENANVDSNFLSERGIELATSYEKRLLEYDIKYESPALLLIKEEFPDFYKKNLTFDLSL